MKHLVEVRYYLSELLTEYEILGEVDTEAEARALLESHKELKSGTPYLIWNKETGIKTKGLTWKK